MSAPAIDERLARRLVDSQFPQWADLPVEPVEHGGVDNRTFRLGERMTVRLPSADWYALQVAKEQRWLPVLAPQLPLPIPTPVARGAPGEGYPYSWSVYRWLAGEVASEPGIDDLTVFATTLAGFLVALRRIDATEGPAPGAHNFFRGRPLETYANETTDSIDALGDAIAGDAARRVWDDATAATWEDDPVWFHGDPACDVVIAWTLLSGPSRDAFRSALGVDPDTWSRGRGWALWKALITLVDQFDGDPEGAAVSRRVIDRVLADHAGEG